MLQHPIIKILGLFLGAYSLLSLLGKLAPLDIVVIVAAGLFALIVWMLRYERAKLQTIYFKPYSRPVIDLVCRIAQEQPPVEAEAHDATSAGQHDLDPASAATTAKESKLQLFTDHDFATASYQLKDAIRGHDKNVDLILEHIRRNTRLRGNSAKGFAQSPLGMFLLIGRPGVGKRSLAIELGHLLYASNPIVLDISGGEGQLLTLLTAARANPYQVFVIENLQAASPNVQQHLQTIAGGFPLIDPATGGKVSFRECFFFFVIHRDAGALASLQGATKLGTGETLMVNNLRSDIGLDTRLIWQINAVVPFLMPPKMEQARVIALIMQKECRKYQLELGHVNPEILAREVQAITEPGGFELAPGRIARRLKQPIMDAISGNRGTVNLAEKLQPALTHSAMHG